MTNLEKRKLLSALSHGALVLNVAVLPVLIPIAVLVLSDDSIVQQNAREAINFCINITVYIFFFLLLTFIGIGIPLIGTGIPLLFLTLFVSWVMLIIVAVHAATQLDRAYRYPFILRVL
ncbi:DUF4870 domain-containing protein [Leptolyngbya sp. FACHB-671]|uniref:DUF4870 domain-containing protein n=1 Tax=Leptolyngbya sp. FACHB-671 TaxID=2692812 RepID=UPI001685D5A3|nr:DUF4870 domain-containing protein [Leptolyngbya sp. FACHB-671]MBD2071842.1 DUF4870 domain-containing protein [Leptolyngbya sp. FACHB-671]